MLVSDMREAMMHFKQENQFSFLVVMLKSV